MPLVVPVLILLALILPAPVSAQNVVQQVDAVLNQVEQALGESFARSLPLAAAAPGVAYSFDPASGNFRRDPATFGQVYLERADPLGMGRLNLWFAYQYVQLETIEGHDADDLRDPYPIPLTNLFAAVQIPRLSVSAEVHQFLFALTYGFSDNIEASIAIPVVYSALRVRAHVAAAALTPNGELVEIEEQLDMPQDVLGPGDIMLRAKYRFLEWPELHAAASLLARLPSGNTSDLQGIGFFELTPTLVASTRLFEPASWARLQGHVNAGIGIDTQDVNSSEARWGIGVDWGVTEDLTAAIAFLGRNEFSRIGSAGSFLFPRCDTDLVTCATDPSARDGSAPLFGITGERADYYNLSVGARAALWRDTLFGFVNVAIPLNDGFVGTAPIPLIGVEGTF